MYVIATWLYQIIKWYVSSVSTESLKLTPVLQKGDSHKISDMLSFNFPELKFIRAVWYGDMVSNKSMGIHWAQIVYQF